jgi:geranylgeranyl diphosphate synthase type II
MLAELKTAAYSFTLPMQLGAVLAGAPDAAVAALGEAGRLLGIGFQLHDDLAGTFGDPAATGKSDLADLREGKCTLLVVHARTTAAWPQVAPHWGDPRLTDAAAAEVRRTLEACGSRAYVETVAARHLEEGLTRARAAGVSEEVLGWLATLPAGQEVGAA